MLASAPKAGQKLDDYPVVTDFQKMREITDIKDNFKRFACTHERIHPQHDTIHLPFLVMTQRTQDLTDAHEKQRRLAFNSQNGILAEEIGLSCL